MAVVLVVVLVVSVVVVSLALAPLLRGVGSTYNIARGGYFEYAFLIYAYDDPPPSPPPPHKHRAYHVWSTRPSHRFFGCITPKNACTSWLKYVRAMMLPPAVSGNNIFDSQPPSIVPCHPPQLASSCFGPANAERLREYIFLAGGSGTEPFSPTVRLGDSVLRVVPC